MLLKALIFAAGLIGAGNWGQYGRARNFDCKFNPKLYLLHEIIYTLAPINAEPLQLCHE